MPADMQLLVDKLQEMKDVYEEAIRNGKYTSLIRSKKLINLLHEYVIEGAGHYSSASTEWHKCVCWTYHGN
ncbi:MAG: hypothetical protein N2V78_06875 [Methanophagales archaeon]|nr:hypothetical protein [Methanophagales archaeon]